MDAQKFKLSPVLTSSNAVKTVCSGESKPLTESNMGMMECSSKAVSLQLNVKVVNATVDEKENKMSCFSKSTRLHPEL